MDDELLTAAGFRARYKVKKSRFYELLNEGQLKAVKDGGLTRIRREDAEAWARSLPEYVPRRIGR
jgi:excisionase family DNA binding protein